ncbi:MAG: hypothetical protein POH28_12385 [Acidocella sp.]|nr:hypothetical protein [Acidocella sp.]
MLRIWIMCGLVLALSGCASARQYASDTLWPFGNPGAQAGTSETARRALGETATERPISPQAGDVWPGPAKPIPTLAEIQKSDNTPLGQEFTPSLPSPYPPGDTAR